MAIYDSMNGNNAWNPMEHEETPKIDEMGFDQKKSNGSNPILTPKPETVDDSLYYKNRLPPPAPQTIFSQMWIRKLIFGFISQSNSIKSG